MLLLPAASFAWGWMDFWQTADQQGAKLLQADNPQAAAQKFANKDWQAVAQYRASNYLQAQRQFSGTKTSDGQYNAANAAAFLGHYQEAIAAYDKAIALNPNNTDAIFNRDLIKKLMNKKQQSQNQASANKTKDKQNMAQNNSPSKQSDQKQSNSQMPAQQQQNESAANAGRPQTQDEDKKQLLRRLADDPGGLLRQKFLRDYYRRHAMDENTVQGDD